MTASPGRFGSAEQIRQRLEPVIGGPWSPPDASDTVLGTMVSPFLGVVKDVVDLTWDIDDVRAFYVGASAADTREILGHPSNSANGGGGFIRSRALNAAIGETVERSCAAYLPTDRLVEASFDELDLPAVDPRSSCLFSDRQYGSPTFPYVPFTRDLPVRWVEGIDLLRGCRALIPAQPVFLNGSLGYGERPITYATSNGLACAPTRREAVVSGLFEAVERDALMIAWHARLSLPLVDLASDPGLARVVSRHFAPTGLDFDVVDLSPIAGVPTALGVVRNRHSDIGALALGAAARPTLAEAALEALHEAFQTRTWCKAQQRQTPRIPDDEGHESRITSFDAHVRYYGERDRARFADFLTASTAVVDPTSAPSLPSGSPLEAAAGLLAHLASEGVDVYAVDVTTPDIVPTGLRVVKVYCPQLQPLDVGWTHRFLGGRRLYEMPKALGLASDVLNEGDLNPHPHPFP